VNTYANLKTSIAAWLAQSNITSSDAIVDDFIDIAEAEVNRRVRLRFMESSTSMTATSLTVSLPADYMGLRGAYIDGDSRYSLEYKTPEQLNSLSNDAGRPRFFTVRGDYMEFPGECDATYTVSLRYYAKPTALSGSNTTNWLTDNYPQLYLYGALKAAAIYVSDDAALAKYSALFDKALMDLEGMDDFEKYGPAPVVSSETYKW